MTPPTLIERLRQARVVQVLVVYLGVTWVLLQLIDTLVGLLSLPEWVGPVAVVLLAIGLVVVLATAWVQSLPTTTAKEEAGEIPTDWQVAPSDALASLRAGRLPHLTWGRAILGGVVALSLLFGGAGLYVGFSGRTMGFGPSEAGADMAAEGIAVLPFDVRGDNLEIWREGMVDLLSNNLDGVGGFRTIDPRTVMARWSEGVGDVVTPDLNAVLRAAGATGARYAVVGSVVGIGDNVRMTSNVYDLDTRQEVAQGQAEGAAGDVLRLVDDLAVGTVRSLLRNTGRQGAGDLTAETLTTESLVALREFLEGERHYRRGDFAEAVQSFERAVAADTSFAIGLVRLSEAYGWLENVNSEKMLEYGERAVAHTDRLPPRYQFIMEAWDALNRGTAEGLPTLKQAVQKYPDDPEAWFLLAETYIHVPDQTFATVEDIQHALDRAIALDPNFAPYWVHQADVAVVREDRAAAERAVARYGELSDNDAAISASKLAIPILLGDSLELEAGLVAAADLPDHFLDMLLGSYEGWTDRFDRLERIDSLFALSGTNRDAPIVWKRVSRGAVRSAKDVASARDLTPGALGIAIGHAYALWKVTPSGPLADRLSASLCSEPFNSACFIVVAGALAGTGRDAELAASVSALRADARERTAAGDTTGAAGRNRVADIMEGSGAVQRGEADRARRLLGPQAGQRGVFGSVTLALLAEVDLSERRWDAAIHNAQGAVHSYGRAQALYIQAKAYEGKGDTAKARDAWRHFVSMTRGGDDEIPRVREGREALARLGG